ncbi:VWA domain-containing protein [Kribbella sp. NPDC050124]|uniref:VWA domain-containing protein n=1 Tax=Kribbella sp. NPDC050124 TaxID=3364114 RepID=UPI0037AA3CE3
MAEPGAVADLPTLVARFGAALRLAGLPVGPDRCERFARAITLVRPDTSAVLYHCALATLVSDPAQIDVLDRVFAAVFGGLTDPADGRGDANAVPLPEPRGDSPAMHGTSGADQPSWFHGGASTKSGPDDGPPGEVPFRAVATATERLATRDFAALSPAELLALADLMRRLSLITPTYQSRRFRLASYGSRVELRATLRHARRTGGDPVRLIMRRRRERHRRLVVLCDISGSMEPYARAMLQLLYCAAGGRRAEVFTFATRLTRLTKVLARSRPTVALERAAAAAPDWSGGTRIGAALKDFNDRYGCRGLARGAVVLVISDGWETGDPARLGQQLARLSRIAYRIVWANPRTQSPRYRPLVGGMAAAWPYCDSVVSAHSLSALEDLEAALGTPRTAVSRLSSRSAAIPAL